MSHFRSFVGARVWHDRARGKRCAARRVE